MDGPYSGSVHNPAEGDGLADGQMVIQQYARYPAALDSSFQSASPAGSARSRLAASASPPLRRKETPRSLQSSPRGPQSGLPLPSTTRSGTSMSPPPLFDAVSRQRPARNSLGPADSRTLPSRDITDETIDDAYVSFILYCNPNVSASVDTSELRRIFRSPPRSDGKSFSIFTLWELIRKLDRKELKTWIQLAIELGVEPPSLEKKQSTQKVQQYAVRLKRWMRAMHVDAFFEYCLGHVHTYYTQLPPSNGIAYESRDGVPLEEDLALRALVPEWKPKRGRKRAEDKENDDPKIAKRPHLDTSVGVLHGGSVPASFPPSAIPFSAFPDDVEPADPWAAASAFPTDNATDTQQGQDFRWRPFDRDASPAGYPQSAIIPRGHHPADMFMSAEPRSAVTPSSRDRSRTRRRHGPAVSSAWPSSNNSTTGKVRGRPPNRGSASGGPFSSFPANPRHSDTSLVDNSSIRSSPAIVVENDTSNRFSNPPVHQSPSPFQPLSSRPSKLQLQVPPHPGGSVRLATPPTLLVNGENDISSPSHREIQERRSSVATSNGIDLEAGPSTSVADTRVAPRITMDDVIRALSAHLASGKVVGRSTPMTSGGAELFARMIVDKLVPACVGVPAEHVPSLCAIYLGVGRQLGLGGGTPGSVTMKVGSVIPRNEDGTPAAARGQLYTSHTISWESKLAPEFVTNIVFNDMAFASVESNNQPDNAVNRHSTLNDSTDSLDFATEDELDDSFLNNASEETWKQRYMRLRKQMKKKEAALREYKRNILQSVMADI